MRNLHLLFLALILSTTFGCGKKSSEPDRITGTWTFAVKPTQNLNNWQGHVEHRTVFDGSEELTFEHNGDFYIDTVNYGTWMFDADQDVLINLTHGMGYPPDVFPQNAMAFEIIKLNDSIMEVYHRYYKFTENKYKLRKKR
ncbi:MAG TPA: hypothetical protein VFC92_04210 [Bacteroidales bacterium]|nr:hypothetical protein [Bacteroidales bacterium]